MRILCVDDDRLVLAITADLIRSLGHDVVEARGGCAAAKALDAPTPIDLMITDIVMPGGPDGIALAQLARQLRPDLRVIFFSGTPYGAELTDGAPLLRKPCTFDELRQAISDAATRVTRSP